MLLLIVPSISIFAIFPTMLTINCTHVRCESYLSSSQIVWEQFKGRENSIENMVFACNLELKVNCNQIVGSPHHALHALT